MHITENQLEQEAFAPSAPPSAPPSRLTCGQLRLLEAEAMVEVAA